MIIAKKLLLIGALCAITILSSCAEKREIKKENDLRERDYKKHLPNSINRLDDRTSLAGQK